MKPFVFLSRCALAGCLFGAVMSQAEPFVPKSDEVLLERLRSTPFDPVAREMRELRARLSAEPSNFAIAAEFARRCIERSRAEADPRYLGHAQAALAPWWLDAKAPNDALVLRATIKQSQHDFTNALADLDLALASNPANVQAWLTRATILGVLGRYNEARRACVPLIGRAPALVAVTAASSIASLNGDGARGCELLGQTLENNPSATSNEKLWALTVLAETAARLDRTKEAEDFFRRALALGQRDAYLLGAYADFLLDQTRTKEVIGLLKEETRADGLLLRLTLAEAAVEPRPTSFETHFANLRARIEASHLRGDTVHRREEARFTLYLLHQPPEALRLAQANWQVQREPADARILLECALAAQDAPAAQPVLDFIRGNRLEEVHLTRLSQRTSVATAK